MAQHRKNVSIKDKELLIKELGHKCANPGCKNYRTHIHHIKKWAVYETNDTKHLIAICPSCHDAVHNGDLRIEDDTLYRWKQINRQATDRDHIYVEPGEHPRMLLGSITFRTENSELLLFKLSEENSLSFRIIEKEILLANVSIENLSGTTLLTIRDNYVQYNKENRIQIKSRPGRIQIIIDTDSQTIPAWMIEKIHHEYYENYFGDQYKVIDIEVLEPSLIKVQGAWIDSKQSYVITDSAICFLNPELRMPICLRGQGLKTIIN